MNPLPLDVVAEYMHPAEKFTDDDLSTGTSGRFGALQTAAETWVREYSGDFTYLKDMRYTVRTYGSLSLSKTRGVLNCMRNEILRAQKAPQSSATPAPHTAHILPGLNRYAVDMDGKMRFFSVKRPEEGRWVGYTFVDELFGAPGSFRKTTVRGNAKDVVLSAIGGDPDALARFGKELGACGVCGSPLTDEASREAGIGPVCMAKLDV